MEMKGMTSSGLQPVCSTSSCQTVHPIAGRICRWGKYLLVVP